MFFLGGFDCFFGLPHPTFFVLLLWFGFGLVFSVCFLEKEKYGETTVSARKEQVTEGGGCLFSATFQI